MSMGYTGVWPRALDSARAVIDRLEGKDRVALVAYDDAAEVMQRLTDDRAAVRGSLGAVQPMRRGTRLAPALRTARQLLLDAPFAAAEVIVISDLQRASASGIAGVEFPSGVQVRGIGVGGETWVNSTVRSLDARRVREGDRTLLAVKARVQNHALPAARQVTASLTVNGREATTASTSLTRDGETVITFTPVPAPDGAVAIRVALPPDSLVADDTLVAVVPRDDLLRVALVAPSDMSASETLYLQQALGIGRAPQMQVERLTSAPSNAAALARTGVVLFWDVAPDAPAALTTWVNDGGGIVLAAGRRLAARRSALPAYAGISFSGLADRVSDRGGTLRDVRAEHALFAPFREAKDALTAVRAWRYPRGDAVPTADILARFDDGVPAVLEQRIGNGRALTLTVPLDNQYGDFPLQPAYLPFVRQLVLHTSGRDATPLWLSTGESWSLPTTLTNPVVTGPTGALTRPQADSAGAAVALPDAGLYTAYAERASGEPGAVQAVNVPPSESELTPMDTTELLLGVRTTSTAQSAASANADAPMTVEEMERRQNPWRVLLIVAALLLLAETILGTRGRRGMARRVVPGTTSNRSAGGSTPAGP